MRRRKATRLTLRQLQIFAAVARAGSTLAAADEIALSQSATSAALNELESLLGGRLFNRVGRRLVLNEHGRSMLPQALLLLDAAQELEAQFGAAGRSGAPQLRIAASTTIGNYVLPRILAAYRRKHGAGEIAVEIDNTQRVATAVAQFEADVGFVEGPAHAPHLRVDPWMRDELVVVAAAQHALARSRKRITLDQLRGASWLLRERGSGTREVVESVLLPHLHQLRAEIEFGSAEAIREAAAEGLGITCLSRYVVADLLKLRRLVMLRTDLPALRRRFYLIRHERRHVSSTLQAFIAHCVAHK